MSRPSTLAAARGAGGCRTLQHGPLPRSHQRRPSPRGRDGAPPRPSGGNSPADALPRRAARPRVSAAVTQVGFESDDDGRQDAGDVVDQRGGEKASADSEEASGDISTWRILQFVLPTLGIWITNPILGLVDTAVVGRNSAIELAALGPGVLLCDHSTYVFTFLSIATANLLAIAFAHKDQKRAEKVISESLMAAVAMGLTCSVAYLYFAPQMLAAIAGTGGVELITPAKEYVQIRALGFAPALVTSVLQSFFLAARNPITPMLSVAGASVLNLGLDLLLCNVLGLGIGGAAAATVASQVMACWLLIAAARRQQPDRKGSPISGWRLNLRVFMPSLAVILNLVKFAGPVGLVLLTKVTMYTVLNGVAASVGAVGTGAHHIAFSIFIFFAVFGDAVSMACQSFVPPTIGRPETNPEGLGKRLILTGAVVGMANSVMASGILYFASGLFASSPEIIAAIATLVPCVAAGLFVHCCSMATEGIMLAGRRYYFLVVSYLANCVLVYLAFQGASGPLGLPLVTSVWVGLLTFQTTRLITNLITLAGPHSVLKATDPLPAQAT